VVHACASGGAAQLELHFAGSEIKIVVQHEHRRSGQAQIACQCADCAAADIHVRAGHHRRHPHRTERADGDISCGVLFERRNAGRHADFFQRKSADVVPRALVLPAGITQADEE
jgi:hypothetical protein